MPRRTQAKCYITANDAKDKDTGVILKERESAREDRKRVQDEPRRDIQDDELLERARLREDIEENKPATKGKVKRNSFTILFRASTPAYVEEWRTPISYSWLLLILTSN